MAGACPGGREACAGARRNTGKNTRHWIRSCGRAIHPSCRVPVKSNFASCTMTTVAPRSVPIKDKEETGDERDGGPAHALARAGPTLRDYPRTINATCATRRPRLATASMPTWSSVMAFSSF